MSRVYDCALVVMRGQGLHKGHQHIIDIASTLADRVLILVGSAQENGTKRNPFNVGTRIELLKSIYDDENRYIIKPLADLSNENDITTDWGKYVLNECKRYIYKAPSIVVYGKEEGRDGYSWFADEDMKKTTQIIVNRNDVPICATTLRDFICMDDRENYFMWTDDKLHKHYDKIRGELMSIPYYQERAKDLLIGKEKIAKSSF